MLFKDFLQTILKIFRKYLRIWIFFSLLLCCVKHHNYYQQTLLINIITVLHIYDLILTLSRHKDLTYRKFTESWIMLSHSSGWGMAQKYEMTQEMWSLCTTVECTHGTVAIVSVNCKFSALWITPKLSA